MNKIYSKLLVALLGASFLVGCSSVTPPKYNPKEFDTDNYQQNVENAVDATDLLQDFNQGRVPEATIDSSDMPDLVQGDLYYNQGNYALAYPYYKKLAYKYKDPKIIYKAINCLEHNNGIKEQSTELNDLVALLVQVDPNSNISRLFSIRVALDTNDLDLAKSNLKTLLKNNPDQGRVIFLFMTSMLTRPLIPNSQDTVNKFAEYIAQKYNSFPEAHLAAMAGFASTNDLKGLDEQSKLIHKYYPNWYIPYYWVSDILTRDKNSDTLISLLDPLVHESKPDVYIQNIYIATLLLNNHKQQANDYLLSQINGNNRDNILIDLGILAAKNQDYDGALNYFNQAKATNVSQAETLSLLKASIYDSQGKTDLAIENYKKIQGSQYLVTISDIMLLNAYLAKNDHNNLDQLLSKLASRDNMDEKQTILFKSSYYLDQAQYQMAYNMLNARWSKYSSDADYIYQFATANASLNKTKVAIELYKKYIKLMPNNAYGYNDLAYLYVTQTKDYKQAKKYAEIAYNKSPNDPFIQDTMGWVYYKLGDYNKAMPLVKASYTTNYEPDSAKHLKDVYIAMKRPDLANSVVVVDKVQVKEELKKQLVQKSLMLLIYVQLGVELK